MSVGDSSFSPHGFQARLHRYFGSKRDLKYLFKKRNEEVDPLESRFKIKVALIWPMNGRNKKENRTASPLDRYTRARMRAAIFEQCGRHCTSYRLSSLLRKRLYSPNFISSHLGNFKRIDMTWGMPWWRSREDFSAMRPVGTKQKIETDTMSRAGIPILDATRGRGNGRDDRRVSR